MPAAEAVLESRVPQSAPTYMVRLPLAVLEDQMLIDMRVFSSMLRGRTFGIACRAWPATGAA
ncbi:hypothetical protein D1122_09045 [Cereibacter sphaeroides]|nr:hypothetical protein D1122_09045 [Cereibacter sphaeroides]